MSETLDAAAAKGWTTVMEPTASASPSSHFVTGNSMPETSWPPVDHPLYGDDKLVGVVTDWLLDQGRTILQLFMLHPTSEREHAALVLGRVNAPLGAKVTSLGSGIGGMEAHWHRARPDLDITLVNASRAQLDRCLCPGALVYGDMRDYRTTEMLWGTQDLVVMAYSLHHCDDPASMLALARMLLKPGGTLLVIDVVDGTPAFTQAVQYRALDSITLAASGLARIDQFLDWHRLPESILGAQVCEVLDRGDVQPSMWIGIGA